MKAKLDQHKPRACRAIAAALAGAWRVDANVGNLTAAEFETAAALLLPYGGSELLWWKVKYSEFATHPLALQLQNSYRLSALHALIHAEQITRVLQTYQDAGLNPILVKGWSIARAYPELSLRPYVDIDLLFDIAEYVEAVRIVEKGTFPDSLVEPHKATAHLDDQPLSDWFARSQLVSLGDIQVRIPALEDHIRLLAVHWLGHGGIKPAGLCDLALLLEQYHDRLDWDLVFCGAPQRAGWIRAALWLVQRMLHIDVPDAVRVRLDTPQPHWLLRTVESIWDNPNPHGRVVPEPLRLQAGSIRKVLLAAVNRWPPNPLQATLDVNGSFNGLPRLPYQMLNFTLRSVRFFGRSHG